MRIDLGKYYINSDGMENCCWISEKRKVEGSETEVRVSGYCRSPKDALASMASKKIYGVEATSLEEAVNEIEKIRKEILDVVWKMEKVIVDKITEYEKRKDVPDINDGEFKVGDWCVYKPTKEKCKILDVLKNSVYVQMLDGRDLNVSRRYLEHAEPPKEKPQVEWVWMIFAESDGRFICKGSVPTEDDAKRLCENFTRDNGWMMIYRKVCRLK